MPNGIRFESEYEVSLLKGFFALNTVNSRWKITQENRNNEKLRFVLDTLRNSFGELITNGKDIANFLNFNFQFWQKDLVTEKYLLKLCSRLIREMQIGLFSDEFFVKKSMI